MRTILLAATLTLAVLPTITPASATERTDPGQSLDVTYSDLNLANPAGADAMLKRIRHAAAKVCGGAPSAGSLLELRQYRACVRTAVEEAVRRLDAPLVTALHQGAQVTDPRFAEETTRRR